MEIRRRKPKKNKTLAIISLAAFTVTTAGGVQDFKAAAPVNPVFAHAPAYFGGTPMARTPYHAPPPNGKVDVTAVVRRFIGGAAISDSS